jgi:hypothetical protein
MLTDQGSHFTSEVLKEVSRLPSMRHFTITQYHPMSNWLEPKDRDKYLKTTFAYRDVSQESLLNFFMDVLFAIS